MNNILNFIDERLKLHKETQNNSRYASLEFKCETNARISELNLLREVVLGRIDNRDYPAEYYAMIDANGEPKDMPTGSSDINEDDLPF